ncbi:MAG: hypothetical protein P8Y92_09670 [Halioglobus sp.]|jgi:uncharacterized low-complexity protein
MAHPKKPMAAALGAAFLAASVAPLASADSNPFSAQQLSGGYDLANYNSHKEGGCGEGKCGAAKSEGEGKCGDGSSGEKKADAEGKSTEGKCGGDKMEAGEHEDGKSGAEGKCGEGKCGG